MQNIAECCNNLFGEGCSVLSQIPADCLETSSGRTLHSMPGQTVLRSPADCSGLFQSGLLHLSGVSTTGTYHIYCVAQSVFDYML